MQFFDSLCTFIDEEGKPLAGGRIVIYEYLNTTNYSYAYTDPDYIVPIDNPCPLDDKGTLPYNLYYKESITVSVEKFVGYDENNDAIYSVVKEFNLIADDISGGGVVTSAIFVDSINTLRNVSLQDGRPVIVMGYFTSGDCPVRTFYYDESNSETDNNGTIIESSLESTGRWLWVPDGPIIDCRTFGVINDPDLYVNSYFASCVNYAYSNGKRVYIPTGNYKLTQGGSLTINCPLDVSRDVQFNTTSGMYTLNLRNGRTEIVNTLAGDYVTLSISDPIDSGNSWEEGNAVPFTAFTSAQHTISGNAAYNLLFTESVSAFEVSGTYTWNSITANALVDFFTSGTFNANKLDGIDNSFLLETTNYDPIIVPELKTSILADDTPTASKWLRHVTDVIHLDSDVTLLTGTSISATIHADNGTITHGGTISATGGVYGTDDVFLSDNAVYVGDWNIDADYWDSSIGLVKSFNASTNIDRLDMKGHVASTTNVTRGGIIKNGTVGRIVCNDEIVLRDMTVTCSVALPSISATSIDAENCIFTNIGNSDFFGENFEGGKILNSTITNNGSADLNIEAANMRIENVSCPNGKVDITVTGGGTILRNINPIKTLTLVPGDGVTLGNVTVKDCSITTINFDATAQLGSSPATAYNILIKDNVYLTGNINSINDSYSYWVVDGHYNIQIYDNEGTTTRSTRGKCIPATYVSKGSDSSGDWVKLTSDNIFILNNTTTDAQPLYGTGHLAGTSNLAVGIGTIAYTKEDYLVMYYSRLHLQDSYFDHNLWKLDVTIYP